LRSKQHEQLSKQKQTIEKKRGRSKFSSGSKFLFNFFLPPFSTVSAVRVNGEINEFETKLTLFLVEKTKYDSCGH